MLSVMPRGRVGGGSRTEHDPRKMANLKTLRRGGASIQPDQGASGTGPLNRGQARQVTDNPPFSKEPRANHQWPTI
jgi:hypothetical protein